ncbi:MAG: hypothetical protein ACI9P9_000397 [Patescibacteria group bacterium]|jgi:hypothetical protein
MSLEIYNPDNITENERRVPYNQTPEIGPVNDNTVPDRFSLDDIYAMEDQVDTSVYDSEYPGTNLNNFFANAHGLRDSGISNKALASFYCEEYIGGNR